MKRLIWILRAYRYMRSRAGWARWDICADMHEAYVVDGWDFTPQEAVDEEMSYW